MVKTEPPVPSNTARRRATTTAAASHPSTYTHSFRPCQPHLRRTADPPTYRYRLASCATLGPQVRPEDLPQGRSGGERSDPGGGPDLGGQRRVPHEYPHHGSTHGAAAHGGRCGTRCRARGRPWHRSRGWGRSRRPFRRVCSGELRNACVMMDPPVLLHTCTYIHAAGACETAFHLDFS